MRDSETTVGTDTAGSKTPFPDRSRLRDRLRRLRPAQPGGAGSSPTHPLPDPLAAKTSSSTRSGSIPGRMLPTPVGDAFCIERVYPLDHARGPMVVGAPLEVPASGWQRLFRQQAPHAFDAGTTAFVDTETTGLERGAGTYAFLIGIGRFTDGGFRVRQYFLRDYHEEPAVMHAVVEELAQVRSLVTFNGRTFDWPLLQTRATLNRLRLPDLSHLDLLFPARRLWRPVTESCRLTQLEQDILGIVRQGDVPGYLIPQLYFTYLHSGDDTPLAGVISHNRLDILTTAVLAGYLGQAAAAPLQAAPLGSPLPGSDLFALGKLLLDRDEPDEAMTCLETALARGLTDALRRDCRKLLATVYKRAGRHAEAVALWKAMVESGGPSITPHIELAKYHEHRAKNFETARAWTLRAMEILQRRQRLSKSTNDRNAPTLGVSGESMPDLAHRLQRIERKLASRRDDRRTARLQTSG